MFIVMLMWILEGNDRLLWRQERASQCLSLAVYSYSVDFITLLKVYILPHFYESIHIHFLANPDCIDHTSPRAAAPCWWLRAGRHWWRGGCRCCQHAHRAARWVVGQSGICLPWKQAEGDPESDNGSDTDADYWELRSEPTGAMNREGKHVKRVGKACQHREKTSV